MWMLLLPCLIHFLFKFDAKWSSGWLASWCVFVLSYWALVQLFAHRSSGCIWLSCLFQLSWSIVVLKQNATRSPGLLPPVVISNSLMQKAPLAMMPSGCGCFLLCLFLIRFFFQFDTTRSSGCLAACDHFFSHNLNLTLNTHLVTVLSPVIVFCNEIFLRLAECSSGSLVSPVIGIESILIQIWYTNHAVSCGCFAVP